MRRCAALRSDVPIWTVRHAQALITLGIFWATVWDVLDWRDLGCSKPRRVDANITCIIAAAPFILYLIASTGRTRTAYLWWHPILQVGLDAFLLPVWLVPTAGAAIYDCKSVCTVCRPKGESPAGFYAWIGSMTCSCFVAAEDDPNAAGVDKAIAITRSRETRLRPGRDSPTTKIFGGAQRIPIVQWAQWAMVLLILITFLRSIYILCQEESEDELFTFIEPDDREAMEIFKDKRMLATIKETEVYEHDRRRSKESFEM